MLLTDDETGTYWDHITGEALHGPLVGAQLDVWPLEYTNVETALAAEPELALARRKPKGLGDRIFRWLYRRAAGTRGWLPPGFRRTMGEEDERLPRMSQGLGVMVDGVERFYPTSVLREGELMDDWSGRTLRVWLGDDKVPHAAWSDGADPPMQVFARWYGFSYSYPGCAIARRGQ